MNMFYLIGIILQRGFVPDYFWPVKQQMVILILQFLYELHKLECVHGLAAEPSSTLEASWLPALCAKLS